MSSLIITPGAKRCSTTHPSTLLSLPDHQNRSLVLQFDCLARLVAFVRRHFGPARCCFPGRIYCRPAPPLAKGHQSHDALSQNITSQKDRMWVPNWPRWYEFISDLASLLP